MRARPAEERERLLEAIAAGASVSSLGIPSATIRSWRRRDPEFARRFAEAQAAVAGATGALGARRGRAGEGPWPSPRRPAGASGRCERANLTFTVY
jgi:hypothetical protein